MRRYAALSLVFSLCLVLLAGCGGSQKESAPADGRGVARFTIHWPEPTKLIPVAAQSIRIRILRGTTVDAQQVVARPAAGQPASVVNFNGLQPGPVIAEATAFPTAAGTGTPQAIGTVAITIIVDQVVQSSLTMNATVTRVTVTPSAAFAVDGRTIQVTGSALDAASAVVLTAGSTWTWTSSDTGVATINTGVNPATLTAVNAGTTVITGTESESGKSAQVTVVVSPSYLAINLRTLSGRSEGYGINNLGQVVGDSVAADTFVHGFRTAPNAAINAVTSDLGRLEDWPTEARDINDSGQAVGASNFNNQTTPVRHAYRTTANAAIVNGIDDLGTLGGSESYAKAINSSGIVVGASDTDSSGTSATAGTRAFVTTPGPSAPTLVDLGALGGNNSIAWDINDSGLIVGAADTAAGQSHAFLFQNGVMSDLGTLGGTRSVAYGINRAGRIVGEATNAAGQTRAFLRQGGVTTDLGTLGGATATARAINSADQIVGQSVPAGVGATPRATLWVNGVAVDLNAAIPAGSGWVLTDARAINDQGQITGVGVIGGQTRAFRLDPQ